MKKIVFILALASSMAMVSCEADEVAEKTSLTNQIATDSGGDGIATPVKPPPPPPPGNGINNP
ncbi:hypothetical protein GV828_01485 [Flavobacterium sp. NST-5]|uniref:Lipoprotein n=1 Tax=Flavobacterium ichthyis TaxID=2698827 RepID=A0ABW9Z6L3_9FLAO|nr:hypothetical protein [Flavobacterium ichthyis]NBL63866.1 hypothetical protein [Flavobacterium ichthyis]